MDHATDELEPSRLQKAVETIAITPEAATHLVGGYRATFESKFKRQPESLEDRRRIAAKIISRYSKLSAAAGAVTAAPSVIPGVGTAVAVLGGGVTDAAVVLKLQVDMCMCLVEVYETELSTEDKKHLAFVLALAGSAEQMAAKGGRAAVLKIAEKLVYQYLRGPALITIKQLFKRVSITFTQKAMAKAIPAGVGVAFSSTANYVLTTVVGKVAVTVLAKDVK
ncbi:EcsC family protein [Streptomyces sp. NPDC088261]|uniref:EcsC family protein n=1 Tax=Streptomyces sp. NPDC088261 TaxID=3365851 RepID=UPI00382D5A9D